MAEDLERLKAIRGAHRGVTTKLTRQAEEIFENESLTSDNYERLFVIYQQLETKLLTLNDYDQRILAVCEVANIENEIEESQQAIQRVMECKRKIDLELKRKSNESSADNNEVVQVKLIHREQAKRKQDYQNCHYRDLEEISLNGAHSGTVFNRRFTITQKYRK